MEAQQIRSVQESFASLQPAAARVATLFYDNLYKADPTLRPLFRDDMHEQGRRLMAMIGAAVTRLDRPDTLLPVLRELGARHLAYGVVDAHYTTVGAH